MAIRRNSFSYLLGLDSPVPHHRRRIALRSSVEAHQATSRKRYVSEPEARGFGFDDHRNDRKRVPIPPTKQQAVVSLLEYKIRSITGLVVDVMQGPSNSASQICSQRTGVP